MKAASLADIKKELSHLSQAQLIEVCLRVSKFKKINKELVNYLLFEAHDEEAYREKVKTIIDIRFAEMPLTNMFFSTKYLRKTLRLTKQYIQYSINKQTEIELLIYFCDRLLITPIKIKKYPAISNLLERLLEKIAKEIAKLHEDLQYDYSKELEKLRR